MAPTNTSADPYVCASYPTLDAATKAPPAYWPPARNATDGQRACVAFPNYYMVQCCGQAQRPAGGSPGMGAWNPDASSNAAAIHDPKCGWEVCISTTTDEQWEECFKSMDAQRGNVANKGYSFNCATEKKKESKKSEEEKVKSGAGRAKVAVLGVVLAVACAVVL